MRLFTGTYPVGVDSQRRLSMPRAWRLPNDDENTQFYLVPGRARRIQIVTEEKMQDIFEKLENSSLANEDKIAAYTDIASKIQPVTLDSHGRFSLSAELAEFSGIKDKAVFLGSMVYGTLMAADAWKDRQTPLASSFDLLQKIEETYKAPSQG
ncbi:MAG: MraZ N-terminal domain containing protein [Lentisphaeria bacterium]|nr:MraZ N-terminal domain containing protein [Lentisphaeria bacterium]